MFDTANIVIKDIYTINGVIYVIDVVIIAEVEVEVEVPSY